MVKSRKFVPGAAGRTHLERLADSRATGIFARGAFLPSLPSFVAVWLFLFPVLGTIGNKSPVDRRFYGNGGIAFWFGDCRFSCGDGASVRWGWTAAHDQLGHQFVALRVPW